MRSLSLFAITTLATLCTVETVRSAKLMLVDGRIVEGKVGQVSGVAADPTNPQARAGEVAVTPILAINDGLRRTYIHKMRIRQILSEARENYVRIRVWQNVADRGGTLPSVGPSIRVTPFDEFGRRIYELPGQSGNISVVQGITQITPVYTRVQGIVAEPRSIVWDMRLSTSSIPRATLSKILNRAIDQDDVDARLQIVRLYIESERYVDARIELEAIAAAHPELESLQDDLRQLRQSSARMILEELQLRARAGQHQLVRGLLTRFPGDEVSGETLQQVSELLRDYEAKDSRLAAVQRLLDDLLTQLDDPAHQELATSFIDEIKHNLSYETVDRLNSFARLIDAKDLDPYNKLALAMSGWIVGANQATEDFAVSLSLVKVRDLVRKYLRSRDQVERARILADIREQEAASPQRVAELVRLMAPPSTIPETAQADDGTLRFAIPGLASGTEVEYIVQLPPEYDPLRKYPTIVALNGYGHSPQAQIEFWAGKVATNGTRLGQAMRHGYITIAVTWRSGYQDRYNYSVAEHHAVLSTLRDAMRRLAIDPDRVFLAGHDVGGQAAWDIALAHPDLWAGVIPFQPVAAKYIPRYWQNAEFVPWYFVMGEKDGDKIADNAREFDRYLRPSFDATIVEYLGRGHEPLGDEIQKLFEWMNIKSRSKPPRDFECKTMRETDNFFWWVEIEGLPPKSVVASYQWPPARGARPAPIRGRIYENGRLSISARTDKVTFWLSPEIVDFDRPIVMELNGRKLRPENGDPKPDIGVILEDVRSRGDRVHPFWATFATE